MNNTIRGLIAKTTAADLTSKEGYLVKLNSSGYVTLTTAASDVPYGVIENGAASGSIADINPMEPGVQLRLKASAGITAGALVQIDGSNNGKVVTATTGAAFGVAENTVATDGLCHVRCLVGRVLPNTVYALTSTNGTAAAAAASLANLAAEAEKIGDDVRAIHAALVTAGILSAS